MKQKLLNYLTAFIFATSVGGAGVAMMSSQPVAAAPACQKSLLTFPPWYRGLIDDNCNILSPDSKEVGGLSNFIWKIALNIIEMVLQIIGYLSVGFIIYGGYRYMISAGSADGMVKARKTITNAIIGLVLSVLSVTIVNIIAGAIK